MGAKNLSKQDINLVKGSVFTERQTNVDVYCSRGRLWITQSGDARDIILKEGEHFEANARKGKLVVQALEDSRAEVVELNFKGARP